MNSKRLTLTLLILAVAGIGISRWLYPVENEFSIMSCTISFLGSPDADRNPIGWRFQQVGMTALILVLVQMIWRRHHNLSPRVGRRLNRSSRLYAFGLLLILLSVWIASSREIYWGEIRSGDVHNKVSVASILILLIAVCVDAWILFRAGLKQSARWPFRGFFALWIAAIICLSWWEWKCHVDPAVKHWPGDGLHSTPLWEWILFSYLLGFMFWISRKDLANQIPSPLLLYGGSAE